MSRKPQRPKRLACRFCGNTVDGRDSMSVSAWTHSHPAVCPYRQDRMPALNGVHVGDLWRNLHTGGIVRVEELRLGGDGTYTDREPVAVTAEVWRPVEGTLGGDVVPPLDELAAKQVEPGPYHLMTGAHPLWSLVEHWEPLSRPGVYPVPWEPCKRFRDSRSVPDEWRCPGCRGSQSSEDKGKLYWHAWHYMSGPHTSGGWEWWHVDPDADPTLVDLREMHLANARQEGIPDEDALEGIPAPEPVAPALEQPSLF